MTKKRASWKTLSTREVYSSPMVVVDEHEVVNPSGRLESFPVVSTPNNASTVAILPNDNVYLLHEYMYPVRRWIWKLPGGSIRPNEKPLTAAKRELLEEAGLRAARWEFLGKFFFSPGLSRQLGYLFLARNLKEPIPVHHEEGELIRVTELPFRQVLNMCLNGDVVDPPTLIGMALVAHLKKLDC